jgi:hypothetical protein
MRSPSIFFVGLILCFLHCFVRERQWRYFANHWALTAFLPRHRQMDIPREDWVPMIKELVPASRQVSGAAGIGALQPPILRTARLLLLPLTLLCLTLAGTAWWLSITIVLSTWAATRIFFRAFGWYWLYRACINPPSAGYWLAVRKAMERDF